MKITIDTKEDSAEEIKKAIQLLSALVQGRTKHSNIFEDDSHESTAKAFANMFSSDTPEPSPEKQEKKEIPKVMEY